MILDAADTVGGSWTFTEAQAIDTVVRMGTLGIVGNGSDNTAGSFDLDRVRVLIRQMRDSRSIAVPARLRADDLVTNTYIDPDIRL